MHGILPGGLHRGGVGWLGEVTFLLITHSYDIFNISYVTPVSIIYKTI